MGRRFFIVSGIFIVALTSISGASELGDRLNRELTGAWGVADVEIYSSCGGSYNDNTVGAGGVASKANHRFDAGEVVKIDNLKVKRQRVDLMLSLDLGIRTPRIDGPFELFDDRNCKVQLIIPIAREHIKSANIEHILAEIRRIVATYPSRDAARDSVDWNGRELEALPEDYDQTLELYATWKAEQTNAAVEAGVTEALDDAADIAEDVDDDADYLAGFGEGAEKMSSFSLNECSLLLTASFSTYHRNPPNDRSRSFKEGWDDGQELIFNILLAGRLQECRVPVPAVIPR